MSSPRLRTDVADAYIFRRPWGELELLQLRRTADPDAAGKDVIAGTWQPVMGHIDEGETAPRAVAREVEEETGLKLSDALGFWALEQVHPYYLVTRDAIMLSPRFAVEAAKDWEPVLNDEHDAHRWVRATDAERLFMWPGQRAAIAEILRLLAPGSLEEPALRLPRG
ncbi:MAG: NUDIX domain-containing protein [Planctomycetota bacterium]